MRIYQKGERRAAKLRCLARHRGGSIYSRRERRRRNGCPIRIRRPLVDNASVPIPEEIHEELVRKEPEPAVSQTRPVKTVRSTLSNLWASIRGRR